MDPPDLDPKTGPKIGLKSAKNRIRCWTSFGTSCGGAFWAILRASLGPRSAQEAPRGAQEGQQELQESKKTIFKKVVFAGDYLHFFALEASQRTPKPQKKGSKLDPKNNKF